MHIRRDRAEAVDKFSQRKVVRRHEADRMLGEERADDRLRSNPPIVRIGAVKDLVEQQ